MLRSRLVPWEVVVTRQVGCSQIQRGRYTLAVENFGSYDCYNLF